MLCEFETPFPALGSWCTGEGRLHQRPGRRYAEIREMRLRRTFASLFSTDSPVVTKLQVGTIPGDGRFDLDRRGAPRKRGGAIISPPAVPAPRGRFAPNNRAAALLRFAAALAGSRGASCAGPWSAHAAGMVPRHIQGDDQWQLSAL